MSDAVNGLEIAAAIAVPALMVVTLAFTGVKGIIRFAQYLARAEAAQDRVADSNETLTLQLTQYMERTDDALHGLDKRLSHVEFQLGDS